MPSSNRRNFLRIAGSGSMCIVTGCSMSTETGELFVRARNMTGNEQKFSITVFVSEEETPSLEDTVTVPAATDSSPPWPEHIMRRKDVSPTESYRVAAVIDGQQYEHQDTANCISRDRKGQTGLSAHHELVDVTVQSDGVEIQSEDCTI